MRNGKRREESRPLGGRLTLLHAATSLGGKMEITVNGDKEQLRDGTSVRGLIEQLGLTDGPVAVELNQQVVPRAEHATRTLQQGDVVELVHFVGGG
jgi:sulfur carrier protein